MAVSVQTETAFFILRIHRTGKKKRLAPKNH